MQLRYPANWLAKIIELLYVGAGRRQHTSVQSSALWLQTLQLATITEHPASTGVGHWNPHCWTETQQPHCFWIHQQGLYNDEPSALSLQVLPPFTWHSSNLALTEKNVKECVPWGVVQYTDNVNKKAAVLLKICISIQNIFITLGTKLKFPFSFAAG